jgi:WD40 repeat protein
VAVAFSSDGTRLSAVDHDLTFKVWNAGAGNLISTRKWSTEMVWRVVFSPDGARRRHGSRRDAEGLGRRNRPGRIHSQGNSSRLLVRGIPGRRRTACHVRSEPNDHCLGSR